MTTAEQRFAGKLRQRQADVTVTGFRAETGSRQQMRGPIVVGQQPGKLNIQRPQQAQFCRLCQ